MKRKILLIALSGVLAFFPVLNATAMGGAEALTNGPIAQADNYEADKAKFQPLIDAMIEAVEADAFGKPAYTWTLPDLTDFINKKIPNMKKEESKGNLTGKKGELMGKWKEVSYNGTNGNSSGKIERIDTNLADGKTLLSDIASYSESNGNITHSSILSCDQIDDTGHMSCYIVYKDKQAPAKLSSLDKALALIDDPEVVKYIKTERELNNNRWYVFSDGTYMNITPNNNIGTTSGGPAKSVDTRFYYSFRNHSVELSYKDGAFSSLYYNSSYDPTQMYRLYNPNSGEHFYTSSREEADGLVTAGWRDEGIGWKAPAMSDTPVYRLYNPNSGDHHYTPSEEEKDSLITAGWNDEGVGWYSFERGTTKLYRLYNPNESTGTHHYTTDEKERDLLIQQGWVDEGIGWYGM